MVATGVITGIFIGGITAGSWSLEAGAATTRNRTNENSTVYLNWIIYSRDKSRHDKTQITSHHIDQHPREKYFHIYPRSMRRGSSIYSLTWGIVSMSLEADSGLIPENRGMLTLTRKVTASRPSRRRWSYVRARYIICMG